MKHAEEREKIIKLGEAVFHRDLVDDNNLPDRSEGR